MSGWDTARVTDIIRQTAQEEILPRFRKLEAHQIREKGPGNLVTEADEAAERVLTQRLTALLPGSLVVGEEAVAGDPTILQVLEREGTVWVLDPVDGTNNFAHHREVFGVIVALVRNGETVAGWIHDPIRDVTATVALGGGAWLGERRMTVAPAVAVEAMTGSLGYRRNKLLAGKIKGLVRQGCVARDYVELATGRIHFAFYNRLAPWDHAAGVLMVQEAGGHAALLDGSPYRPRQQPGAGLLIAPDEASWNELRPYIEE